MGPRYNVQSTEGPLRYPTPPELVLLYNPKRGTPGFGGAKIVPDVSTSHQNRASGTPAENLRKTCGTPAENLRKTCGSAWTGTPSRSGSSLRPSSPPSALPQGAAHMRRCQLVF